MSLTDDLFLIFSQLKNCPINCNDVSSKLKKFPSPIAIPITITRRTIAVNFAPEDALVPDFKETDLFTKDTDLISLA